MENIKVRRATADDFDKVIGIRKPEDVYNGFDYLPYYFYHLINSENVLAFVAIAGDKFVGFDIAYFVDNGERVVTRAARVSKEYEGQGVMKLLWNHIQDVIKKELSVKYHIYWMTDPSQNALQNLKQKGYEIVMKKKTMTFFSNNETIQEQLSRGITPLASKKRVDQKSLEIMFDEKNLLNKLFPQKRLVIDWVPYTPIQANIPLIFSQTTSCLCSISDDSDNVLLTFGSHFRSSRGIVFNIDIYGTQIKNIVAHLSEHIKYSELENETTEMLIRFYVDEVGANEQLIQIVTGLNLPESITEFGTGYCVEKNLLS